MSCINNPRASGAAMDPAHKRRRFAVASARFVRCFTAVSAAVLAVAVPALAASPPDYPAMMRLAVDQWIASQNSSGLFSPYGFDFLADKPLEPERVSPSNF